MIAVSIGYAALILGFSIEGSELAAILGFAILRGMLRRNSIIEESGGVAATASVTDPFAPFEHYVSGLDRHPDDYEWLVT